MKKILLFAVMALALGFVGCSGDDDGDSPVVNVFKGTSWTAPDPVGEMLWGRGATTTIEFIDETKCQEIDYQPTGGLLGGANYRTKEGTYTFEGNTVTWIIEEKSTTGSVTGSILKVPGYTYTKNP